MSFVYLCYQSQKEQWRSAISKYNLEGNHYFVEENQADDLINLFSIKGYPTYTIIDKNAKIVKSNGVYRPSNSGTVKLLDSLIKS